jgi:hypothetical protein
MRRQARGQERGQCDQAAAAADGVDGTGQEGRRREEDDGRERELGQTTCAPRPARA